MHNLIKTQHKNPFIVLCLLAIGSFFLTLNLPLVGEEGVYTNAALEMIFSKNYKLATLYGNIYPRPPLYNWLIILFSKTFGATNIVLCARLVTLIATTTTAILLFYTTKFLTNTNNTNHLNNNSLQNSFPWLTVAVFLSGDLLFKRGWLAYSDPVFALFVFASMALLIIGTLKQNLFWVYLANLCVFLGFLCKTPTSYVFYFITYLILLGAGHKKFLLSITNICLCLSCIVLPILWLYYTDSFSSILATIYHTKRLMGINHNPETNFLHNLICLPIQTFLALLPSSLIILLSFKKKAAVNNPITTKPNIINNKTILIILVISTANFLPYWLGSQSYIRYLLPLYPWFALLLSYVVWEKSLTKSALILLGLTIFIKYLTAMLWFPYEYQIKSGNAYIIAKDILRKTINQDIYIQDYSANGLRIAGAINQLRWPNQPLQEKPTINQNYYFILKEYSTVNNKHMRLIKTYTLKKSKVALYLYTNYSDISP